MNSSWSALLAISMLLLVGCASEAEQQAANGIASRFGARSCHMSYGVEAGKGRYVEVNLDGVENLKGYRNMEFVTSITALRYFDGLSAEQKAKYDEIRVKVTGDGVTFEKAYAVADIPDVKVAEGVVDRYMTSLLKKTYRQPNNDLDRENLTDSAMAVVNATYDRIDSIQGPFMSYGLVGYEAAVAKNGVPVVQLWADAPTADSAVYYFTFVMNRQDKKLVRIAFE